MEFATTGAPVTPSVDPVAGINATITFNMTAGVVVNNATGDHAFWSLLIQRSSMSSA